MHFAHPLAPAHLYTCPAPLPQMPPLAPRCLQDVVIPSPTDPVHSGAELSSLQPVLEDCASPEFRIWCLAL